jgi:hypothetical protein
MTAAHAGGAAVRRLIDSGDFRFLYFDFRSYNSGMAEHIEDLQHRFTELKKRVDVVRSFL